MQKVYYNQNKSSTRFRTLDCGERPMTLTLPSGQNREMRDYMKKESIKEV
jgi:hypothetical protein